MHLIGRVKVAGIEYRIEYVGETEGYEVRTTTRKRVATLYLARSSNGTCFHASPVQQRISQERADEILRLASARKLVCGEQRRAYVPLVSVQKDHAVVRLEDGREMRLPFSDTWPADRVRSRWLRGDKLVRVEIADFGVRIVNED